MLFTRPRQESRVLAHLDRLGVPYCAPRVAVAREQSRTNVGSLQWLFPRYIFVKVDFERTPLNYLKFMAGVAGFVRIGQVLAEISDEVIEAIGHSVSRMGAVVSRPRFSRGERVTVQTGSFSGLDAVFLESDGETRSCLLLRWLGRELQISVDNHHIHGFS